MIHRNKIITALEAKAELFAGFDREFQDNSALYQSKLSEQMVNLRRFRLEIDVLCEYMNRYARENDCANSPPVVFLDSSIVISFAERWHDDQRKLFIEPVVRLLDTAQVTGIPVIG